ncbi:hypothetical protein SynA15127_00103 [Synechococcus sp. A15-127]|nr:hypothetical protein SynA15127_00103 [Synechococcus sp. A15-127]
MSRLNAFKKDQRPDQKANIANRDRQNFSMPITNNEAD